MANRSGGANDLASLNVGNLDEHTGSVTSLLLVSSRLRGSNASVMRLLTCMGRRGSRYWLRLVFLISLFYELIVFVYRNSCEFLDTLLSCLKYCLLLRSELTLLYYRKDFGSLLCESHNIAVWSELMIMERSPSIHDLLAVICFERTIR